MCSQSELAAITKAVAKEYCHVFGSAIDRILLYGSYARGSADGESDIDMVAIVHGEREDLQKKLDAVWDASDDLELQYGVLVSPTVIPYQEFMEYKDVLPYYRNIVSEGVPVSA